MCYTGQYLIGVLQIKGVLEVAKQGIKAGFHKQFTSLVTKIIGFPLDKLGNDASDKLAMAESYEKKLVDHLESLTKTGSECQNLEGKIKGRVQARAVRLLLGTATKYSADIEGFQGNIEMLLMAMQRSPVELATDENELDYLLQEIQRLKDKDATEINWRDTAESWSSTLALHGSMRGECSQQIFGCMAADSKLLRALGGAQALMRTVGRMPASFISLLSRHLGGHIRNSAYRYIRRISSELVRIQRVKGFQLKILAFVGAATVAIMVAIGNFVGVLGYAGVTSSSLLAWLLPVSLVLGILACVLLAGAVHLCCRGKFVETLSSCCSELQCSCCAKAEPGTSKVYPGN